MSNYDRSTYKNDTTQNNISLKDTLDPYYTRHDNRGGNPIASMVLIMIGIVFGMVALATLRACDTVPVPAAMETRVRIDCRNCHAPIAKNYRELRKLQKSRANYDKWLLSELVAPHGK